MKNLLDLRFIIGLFFLSIGILLLAGSFILQPTAHKSEIVNRWSGVFYIAFSVVMLALWKGGKKETVLGDDE